MLVVEHANVIDWIKKNLTSQKPSLGQRHELLVILPSNIVIQNFGRALFRNGIPPAAVKVATFDDLAEEVLRIEEGNVPPIINSVLLSSLAQEKIRSDITGNLKMFQDLPVDEIDTLVTITREYEEYLRACDVGNQHDELVNVANLIDDPYLRDESIRRLNALQDLLKQLEQWVKDTYGDVYQTRNDVLKAAIESIEQKWPTLLDNIRGVAVAAVTVFDSMTTQLMDVLSESGKSKGVNVHVFAGAGTYTSLTKRFGKGGMTKFQNANTISSQVQVTPSVPFKLIAAPDRRREILIAASKIRELLISGVRPEEILLVARDSGRYLSFIEDIFPSYGIPFFVQTRRPHAHLYEYGFLLSLLELAANVEEHQILSWETLTATLRQGFCTLKKEPGWPIDAREIFYLEERLSWLQRESSDNGYLLAEWKTEIESRLGWEEARDRLLSLIDHVEKMTSSTLTDVSDAISILEKDWNSFVYRQTTWQYRWSDPRVAKEERFNLFNRHPTAFRTKLRNQLHDLGSFLERYLKAFPKSLSWRLVAAQYKRLIYSDTFGLPDDDLAAVPFIDAGNSWFRDAKHVFMFGMRSDEFPRKFTEGMIIPTKLREQVDPFISGVSSTLYLRNPQNDYESELDFYEASLKTAQASITYLMPYLDDRGHTQEWSSFIENQSSLETKYPPDYWIPTIEQPYSSFFYNLPNWTRWLLFAYHTHRLGSDQIPPPEQSTLEELGTKIDPAIYSERILPRINRYLTPPVTIQVSASESWYKDDLLEQLAGPPFHTHELDLHSECPLQFYFFQFLYNIYGDEFDRTKIPTSYWRFEWRYGIIPRRLSYIYPDQRGNKLISEVINKWPRSNLASFNSTAALKQNVSASITKFQAKQILSPTLGDWRLVHREKKETLTREWTWDSNNQVTSVNSDEGQVDVYLPPHRLDPLDDCRMVLAYVNYSQQIDSLWEPVKHRRKYKSIIDPMKDHRLPLLLYHYEKIAPGHIAGGLYVELHSGFRKGYFRRSWTPKHFEYKKGQVLTSLDWTRRITKEYPKAIVARALSMKPDPDIQYVATPDEKKCNACVYATLCQIGRRSV